MVAHHSENVIGLSFANLASRDSEPMQRLRRGGRLDSLDSPDFEFVVVLFGPYPGKSPKRIREEPGAILVIHHTATGTVLGPPFHYRVPSPFRSKHGQVDEADDHHFARLRGRIQPCRGLRTRRFCIPVESPMAGKEDMLTRPDARHDQFIDRPLLGERQASGPR